MRDGAVQTVAVFATEDAANAYIKAQAMERFWDVEAMRVQDALVIAFLEGHTSFLIAALALALVLNVCLLFWLGR